jgi:hypothetical protein
MKSLFIITAILYCREASAQKCTISPTAKKAISDCESSCTWDYAQCGNDNISIKSIELLHGPNICNNTCTYTDTCADGLQYNSTFIDKPKCPIGTQCNKCGIRIGRCNNDVVSALPYVYDDMSCTGNYSIHINESIYPRYKWLYIPQLSYKVGIISSIISAVYSDLLNKNTENVFDYRVLLANFSHNIGYACTYNISKVFISGIHDYEFEQMQNLIPKMDTIFDKHSCFISDSAITACYMSIGLYFLFNITDDFTNDSDWNIDELFTNKCL